MIISSKISFNEFEKKIIEESFDEAILQTESKKRTNELSDDLVLLESGLDSLGFAIFNSDLGRKTRF